MDSPLAEDHATLGWSADGQVPLQPRDHFDILHLSQRSVHSVGKTSSFVLPFLHAGLLWSPPTWPKNKKQTLMDKTQREGKNERSQKGKHKIVFSLLFKFS